MGRAGPAGRPGPTPGRPTSVGPRQALVLLATEQYGAAAKKHFLIIFEPESGTLWPSGQGVVTGVFPSLPQVQYSLCSSVFIDVFKLALSHVRRPNKLDSWRLPRLEVPWICLGGMVMKKSLLSPENEMAGRFTRGGASTTVKEKSVDVVGFQRIIAGCSTKIRERPGAGMQIKNPRI